MADILSNVMADKAEKIRTVSLGAEEAGKIAAEKMIEAGRLLVEAKEACPHGEWAAFLERAGIHERKARRYMLLARSGLKSDTVSEMGGLKAALQHIGKRDAFYRFGLPSPGHVLLAYFDDIDDPDHMLQAYIWEDNNHPSFYRVAATDFRNSETAWLLISEKPMKPDPVPLGNGNSYYVLWEFLNHLLGGRADDCVLEFVPDFAGMRAEFLKIGGARNLNGVRS